MTAGLPAAPAVTFALVAQPTPPPADPGGRGEDFGKSAPVGLVVIILFFIAVFFLVRSMNKHLRRVPESFDPPQSRPPDSPEPPQSAQSPRSPRSPEPPQSGEPSRPPRSPQPSRPAPGPAGDAGPPEGRRD